MALVIASTALVMGEEVPGDSTDSRAVIAQEEAFRLASRLQTLWPGWDASTGAVAEPPALLDAALAEEEGQALEQAIARELGGRLHAYFLAKMPAPRAFDDGVEPAPEVWRRGAIARSLREEARLLLAAIEAPKAKKARALARELALTRYRRVAATPAHALAAWRHEERCLGLALYSVHHALLLARHDAYEPGRSLAAAEPEFRYRGAERLRAHLIAALRRAASPGSEETLSPELSGAALALVLDRTRHGWRASALDPRVELESLLVEFTRPFGNQGEAGEKKDAEESVPRIR